MFKPILMCSPGALKYSTGECKLLLKDKYVHIARQVGTFFHMEESRKKDILLSKNKKKIFL